MIDGCESLYRVMDDEERTGVVYDSRKDLSARKSAVLKYFDQIDLTCRYAERAGLSIEQALHCASCIVGGDDGVFDGGCIYEEFRCAYLRNYEESGVLLNESFHHGQYFWEVIWELVRRREVPRAVSRLSSCFLFADLSSAEAFAREYRSRDARVVRCITHGGRLMSYDMNWLTSAPFDADMPIAQSFALKYWRGLYSAEPCVEVLFEGLYEYEFI